MSDWVKYALTSIMFFLVFAAGSPFIIAVKEESEALKKENAELREEIVFHKNNYDGIKEILLSVMDHWQACEDELFDNCTEVKKENDENLDALSKCLDDLEKENRAEDAMRYMRR